MTTNRLRLGPPDTSEIDAITDELSGVVLVSELPHDLAEALDAFINDPSLFIVRERYIAPASGAYEMIEIVKPSAKLLELVSAVRARISKGNAVNVLDDTR